MKYRQPSWYHRYTSCTPLSPPGEGPGDPFATGASPDGVLMRADSFDKGIVKMALSWREKM